MTITIRPGIKLGPGTGVKVPLSPPDGSSALRAGANAWQIKQDHPNSADGVYWIKNANINSGAAFEIYADMTTLGGGWTLILQNNIDTSGGGWGFANCLLRNQTTPPTSPNDRTRSVSNSTDLYSIIAWADSIKRSASGFDYMLDAWSRGRNGGAWTANDTYSFTAQKPVDTVIGDYQYQTAGWRKNITEITKFPAGVPGSSATWNYNDSGLEARMPWYGKLITDAPGANSFDPNAGQALITTNGQDGSWWGSLVTQGGWNPAPWMGSGIAGDGQFPPQDPVTGWAPSGGSPGIIWYWVR